MMSKLNNDLDHLVVKYATDKEKEKTMDEE